MFRLFSANLVFTMSLLTECLILIDKLDAPCLHRRLSTTIHLALIETLLCDNPRMVRLIHALDFFVLPIGLLLLGT